MSCLRIPKRFCGPPGAANGGYLAGRLAEIVGGPVEVTFRSATPLECDVPIEPVVDGVKLLYAESVTAEARAVTPGAWVTDCGPSEPAADAPAVSLAEAIDAMRAFPRAVDHPVPRCFVCGTEREPGDGLRIFPGPVPGREHLWAAPWTPDPSLGDEAGFVRAEFLWAALDCTGAFAVNEPPRGLALLGKLAARIDRRVGIDDRLVVIGWPIARGGRKLQAGTAIATGGGEAVAVARATWILTG